MNENEVKKIYDDALENWPTATDAIKGAYADFNTSLEDYFEQIQKEAFCYGYEKGQDGNTKELLNKLEDIAKYMELAQGKACAIAGNIDQRYFELAEDSLIIYYFKHYKAEFSILFDYILEIGNRLTELKLLIGIE